MPSSKTTYTNSRIGLGLHNGYFSRTSLSATFYPFPSVYLDLPFLPEIVLVVQTHFTVDASNSGLGVGKLEVGLTLNVKKKLKSSPR